MEPTIRELQLGMKSLSITFIILDIGRPTVTKGGHEVRTCKVADHSGSINLCLWDEPGTCVQQSDICKITRGYVSLWKGCPTLYTGKGGDIQKVGEFCLPFSETPFMSEPIPEYLQQVKGRSDAVVDQRLSPTPQLGGSGYFALGAAILPPPSAGVDGGRGCFQGEAGPQGLNWFKSIPLTSHSDGLGVKEGLHSVKSVRPSRMQ